MTEADDQRADFTGVAELAETFTALVEAISSGDELPALSPDRIVALAAECGPARDIGLAVAEGDRARVVSATSDVPRQVERIRVHLQQGPVLDIVDTNDLVISNDLAADLRWPQFGAQVVEQLGIRSIVGYRLYLAPGVRAALTYYSEWPHAFDELAIASGSIFAAYCSLVVFTENVLGTQLTPRRAAEVHREIGIAVGILMATDKIDVAPAFDRLHRAGRRLRRTLPDVARRVVDDRRLPEEPPSAEGWRDGRLPVDDQSSCRARPRGPRVWRPPMHSAATTTSMIVTALRSATSPAAPGKGDSPTHSAMPLIIRMVRRACRRCVRGAPLTWTTSTSLSGGAVGRSTSNGARSRGKRAAYAAA